MASFKIPHGKTYTFSITVLERNSYLPKNLANMDVANSSFSLVKLDDLSPVAGTITLARVPDDKLNASDPDTYANGKLSITIPNTVTSTLVYERGDKVDNYYSKPTYNGIVTVKFADDPSDIVAVVPNICVIPTGV
jgi:hypothetical protein